MRYDQYTVPDTVAVRFTLRPWPLVPFFPNFFEEHCTQNHPQYLLLRALFPTRGSQWRGVFYGYRLKFWLFYGYRLIFFSYG